MVIFSRDCSNADTHEDDWEAKEDDYTNDYGEELNSCLGLETHVFSLI
jgi:hypothetical protein